MDTTTTSSSEETGLAGARDEYRVAVVGDAGVGKTSLVSTLVHPVPPDTLPRVLPAAVLPPLDGRADAADGLPGVCVVVDTPPPGTAAQRAAVAAAVRGAHCVVVVVDALRPATLARVFDFWEGFVARARAGGSTSSTSSSSKSRSGRHSRTRRNKSRSSSNRNWCRAARRRQCRCATQRRACTLRSW